MSLKTIVVVSTLIDTNIKEIVPGTRVYRFSTLIELSQHIETTPVRADAMYLTRDVLGSTHGTALKLILEMLENPFLKVNEIVYITEPNSSELTLIDFMLEDYKDIPWRTQIGSITREYITGLIAGTLRTSEMSVKRMAVYRQPKNEYLRNKLQEYELEEDYPVDEKDLQNVPDEDVPEIFPLNVSNKCKALTVSGLDSKERTLFAFILAQYCASKGQTVIIERDLDYLTLSDMVSKSGIDYMVIDLEELYRDVSGAIRSIKNTICKFILITTFNREIHDYTFICNLIYNNLYDNVDYLVMEKALNEVSPGTEYTLVMPNTVPEILMTVQNMPPITSKELKVAMLNVLQTVEYAIPNTVQMRVILEDLLQYKNIKIQNLNIRSLRIGGEAHDLHMFITE